MTIDSQPRKEDAATQQIAREAAMKILPQDSYDTRTKIILSAIERATDTAWKATLSLLAIHTQPRPRKAPSERSEEWKQSVEDRLDRIERRLQNVPHY